MELNIIDTGYISATTALASQTPLDVEDRAGFDGTTGVTVLKLTNVLTQTIGSKANVNAGTQAGLDRTEVSKNSTENEGIILSCSIDTKSLPAGTFDKNYIYQLNRLKKTTGVKLLYPSGTGNYTSALMYLGAEFTNGIFSTGFVPTDIPYLPVIVTDVKFTDRKDVVGKCKVDITCMITK